MDPISAWEDGEWEILIDYLAAEAGVFASNIDTAKVGIGTWIYQSLAENIVNNLNTFKAGVSVKGDKVLVSTDAMNALKNLTDAYIADCGDYVIYPSKQPSDMAKYTAKMHNDLYSIYLSELNKSVIAVDYYEIGYTNGASLSMVKNITDYYLVSSNPTSYNVTMYDKNCDKYEFPNTNYYRYSFDGEIKVSEGGHSGLESLRAYYYDKLNYYCITTLDGRGLKYWKSLSALQAYLRGTPLNAIYLSTAYNNYNVNNDNSISVDASTINYIFEQGDIFRTDISQVVNNVTQTVNNYYITNGSVMSQEEIQLAIDKALQIFLESLPSGGGGEPTDPDPDNPGGDVSGNDPTVSGNDVSGNGVDGPLTVGWLEKIYNTLKDIPGNLVDSLVGVFVPEPGYFTEYFNRLNDFFSDKFGFLYSPVDFMIQFFEIFLSIGDAPELTFPGFAILGHTVWEPITVNWEELVADFGLFGYIRIGGDIVIVVAFLNFVQKKCTEVLSS